VLKIQNECVGVNCPKCGNEYYDERLYRHLITEHNLSRIESEKQTERVVADFSTERERLKEKHIIGRWVAHRYPDSWFLREVPISDSHDDKTPKKIDAVLSREAPFDTEEEEAREAISAINVNTGEVSKKVEKRREYMQIVLDNLNSPISIFEAKQELNFKAIGQALAYSKFFSDYYNGYVDEVGIIYVEGDSMCKKTAKSNGISTYKVDI
jgi:hypothetical protein